MKKFLSTVAALAFVATSGVAQADTSFSGTTPITGTTGSVLVYGLGVLATGVGYDQSSLTFGNTENATSTVTNTWVIKGAVAKDCSYYGGNGSNATSHTLDFGTIGVNTQAATSVHNAFDMVGPATAVINTTTAGCNFNNTVTLKKTNGADGLKNTNAGGYDSNEFQANIPYSVSASFNATTNQSAGAVGTSQTLTALTTDQQKVGNYGAWRSNMALTINAPVPANALVAGNYQDTLTVELKAL